MLIDGLQCGFFDRGVFEDLKAGGFTAITNTLGFWEGAVESLDAVGRRTLWAYAAIMQWRRKYGALAVGDYIARGATGADDSIRRYLRKPAIIVRQERDAVVGSSLNPGV